MTVGKHLALCSSLMATSVFGAGLTFLPDATFKGSALTGWHVLGSADWRAHDGELTGVPKSDAGGWLVLDRSYQDVGFHAQFRCTGGCKTGLLLRTQQTPTGMTGVFVTIEDREIALYRLSLDPHGQETHRDKLRSAGGAIRVAPPLDPNAPARGGRGGRGAAGAATGPALPLARPERGLRPNEWNEFEVLLDANIVRAYLNEDSETGGVADDDAGRYGPIALYIGGTGEVRFKEVAYKDLAFKVTPPETVSPHFRVQRISDMYYSWSAAAADFNHDGVLDVVAGPYIYYGPDFTKSREIYPAAALNPSKDFTGVNCQYAFDFNGDGWPDILTGPPRGTLYINPKGESRRWDKYEVVVPIQSEVTLLKDIDGDGRPELVFAGEGFIRYAKYDPADPTKPWVVHSVSERGYAIAHGIGVGDINGDGRMDIVNPYGWWEQPAAGSNQEPWTYHPEAFARYGRNIAGGSVMAVFDLNGDGKNDVVTNLNAHGFGLAWFEQTRDASGKIGFVRHMVTDDYSSTTPANGAFSQPHGSTFADVDGDGIPDFIVGKRYFSHLDTYLDPDPYGPPVLYWFRTVRDPNAPGKARLVPEMIHNRSGAGSDVLAVDLNKDGIMDIVTSTDRGTFIFWGKK
jgi:hypothetical protein